MLVEDDVSLATGLTEALRGEGFAINHVGTGNAALHVITAEPPDIVILDLGLPDIDGLEVLRQLRAKNSDMPVLLLTARDSLGDKIAGLDSGADDYLAKPFEMDELLARLRALSRRVTTANANVISIDPVNIDISQQEARINGEPIELSRKEYMLLRALMENAGRVQTRDQLERRLYNWGEEIASNAVEVHVHHLRKKIANDFIQTVRGVGYRINKP